MEFKKVVVLGGGVLGVQIALMNAYTGHDTTIWLRSESSIGRAEPRIRGNVKISRRIKGFNKKSNGRIPISTWTC